ncbi:MAG: 3-oxoacid CoA-transferase [Proteobacteria bacterium]|nr:3-oxoacid CoA-transferase [Pseudomonadota bacterium]
MEMMIVAAAKELENGVTIAVGTGAPCAAAMLAQKTSAPDLIIFFEAGGIHPTLVEMPISVGDSRTFYKASRAGSMGDVMDACARGLVDYTFLGGAQIDMYGNLNSTMIGKDYTKPSVRFPGSGGANDFASLCWRTMVMTIQDKRRFVRKMDFITSPGWLSGHDSRSNSGLPDQTGPHRIITNMAIMDFEPVSRRMRVISLHPGYSVDEVQDNCGFELLRSDSISVTPEPTDHELKVLREDVDPEKYLIGR